MREEECRKYIILTEQQKSPLYATMTFWPMKYIIDYFDLHIIEGSHISSCTFWYNIFTYYSQSGRLISTSKRINFDAQQVFLAKCLFNTC